MVPNNLVQIDEEIQLDSFKLKIDNQDLRNCHMRSLCQGTAFRSLDCCTSKERERVEDFTLTSFLLLKGSVAIAHHFVGKLRKRVESNNKQACTLWLTAVGQ
jgi:hypothetical protein